MLITRQSAALDLAAEVTEAERLQYIATMNTDDLNKARSEGFDADPYIIEPCLTDQPDGGLVGFRFLTAAGCVSPRDAPDG